MTSAIEAIGLIIDGSRRLEHQLREVGAYGSGLKELSESVSASLSAGDLAKIRRVYVLRNKVAHDTYEVDEAALAQFQADIKHILAELSPSDDPDSAMRKRIRKADVVDDEMYEWLQKEAAKRMEAHRISASDAQPLKVAEPATQPVSVQHGSVTALSGSPIVKQLKTAAKDAALTMAVRAFVSLIK